MNASEHFFLPDVQSSADERRLAIQMVGVKGLRYPCSLKTAGASIAAWKVASENFESIHNHSAYAELYGSNA